MPHTLRSVEVTDRQVAELSMLCGFDDDLAKQATASSNRIRGLLTQIHPALERVIGPHLALQAMPELLAKYPTPAALRRAGHARVEALPRKHSPRAGKRWAAEVFAALDEQSVVVSGTGAAGVVLPRPARMLAQTRIARTEVPEQVEAIGQAHPLHLILTSLPAVGVRTEAKDPHRGHGQGLQDRRASGFLCRAGTGHLAFRDFHPRRSLLAQG